MKAKCITLLTALLCILYTQTTAQQIGHSHIIGGEEHDIFYSNDTVFGHLWSVGATQSNDITGRDGAVINAWLFVSSLNGDSLLSVSFGSNATDGAFDVIELPPATLIIHIKMASLQ